MISKRQLLLLLALFLPVILCGANFSAADAAPPESLVYRTLAEDTSNFYNPEKGWYAPRYTNSVTSMSNLKNQFVSTVLLECYLYDFKDGDISPAKLSEIRNAFNICRQNNLSVMFRAGYTFVENGQPTRQTAFEPSDINIILRHIQQLAPIFYENEDILYCIQAGFFGPWGEWHESIYSTVTWGDWISLLNQKIVIDALMEAAPASVAILVRTPNYIRLLADGQTLNETNAFSGSTLSRLGYHNDGLFNGVNDAGTYMRIDNNGVNNSGSYASTDQYRAQELAWVNNHCQYTPFVAESNGVSSYADSPNAVYELGLLHAQLLNIEYHPGVLNKWKSETYNGINTYDYITHYLGYNFVLRQVGFAAAVHKGETLHIQYTVENNGFGNLIKEKDFEVVLSHGEDVYITKIAEDPRKWYKENGLMTKDTYVSIPSDIPSGTWRINFRISNTAAALKENPYYSVRLANIDTWQPSTGLNYIGDLTIEEKPTVSGALLYQGSGQAASVELYGSNKELIDSVTTVAAAGGGAYTLTLSAAPEADTGYTLVISKPGYLKYTVKNLTLTAGAVIETIDLRQLAGDIDGNGVVNATDLTYLLSEFNRNPATSPYPYADIDGNGLVNATDLTYLLAGFNKHDVEIINN